MGSIHPSIYLIYAINQSSNTFSVMFANALHFILHEITSKNVSAKTLPKMF